VREPHYWNRANFEELASLSSALRADARLEHLASYCELREKGLRRQAFAELRLFLDAVRAHEVPVQRQLALHVFEVHCQAKRAHQFMAEPLRKEFLERVLEEWRAAEPLDPIPTRTLALLMHDQGLLRQALDLNPKDDAVRASLAMLLLDFVDYATHHLSEGSFIGDEAEAADVLREAAAVLEGVSDPVTVSSLRGERESLAALLDDWRQYRQAPAGTFPDWCRARGRTYGWPTTVYYDGTPG
jgi:hypothetical protein